MLPQTHFIQNVTCKHKMPFQSLFFFSQCLLASASQLSNQELNSAISYLSGLKPASEEHTSLSIIIRQLAAKLTNVADSVRKHPVILVLDKVNEIFVKTCMKLRELIVAAMVLMWAD